MNSDYEALQKRVHELEGQLSAAQQQAAELKAVLDALQHPVMVYDREGRMVQTNPSAVQVYGFDPSHRSHRENNQTLVVRGPDCRNVNPDEMPVARALRGETVQAERLEIASQSGLTLTVLGSAAPLEIKGVKTGAVVVWHDITAQAQAEAALRASQDRYKALFESIDAGFCIIEVLFDEQGNPQDYRFLEINPGFEGQTGLRDALGKRMRELRPDHEPHWFETYGRISRTGSAERFTNEARQLDGRWYDVYAFRVGRPEEHQVAVLFNDITARKQAEEALKEKEAMLRLALNAGSAGAWSWDLRTQAVQWSDEYFRIFGFEPGSIQPSVELGYSRIHPDDLLRVEDAVRLAMAQNRPIDEVHRVVWPDQSIRWVRGLARAFYTQSGQPERMTGIAIDITGQKQAEIELQAAHARTVEILESISDAFYSLDPDERFTYVNQKAAGLWGKSPAELLGKNIWDVFPSGKETEAYRQIQQALVDRQPRQFETYSRFLDQWLDIHLYPGAHGISVYFQDITPRKHMEATLTESTQRLERSNRELEQFAYVASHDLQEPLRKIEAFSDSLLEHAIEWDERQRDYVARMRAAAQRMQSLVTGLLQLSRVHTQGQPFQRVDLSETAAEVLSDLEHQVRRTGGQVAVGELPEVEGDPLQLHQLLQNLIGNALKYHRPDTPPVVLVSAQQLPGRVRILVEDNGIGFNSENGEQMFLPFKRLVGRNDYEGSGLGLAICRRIVERHGGEINAQGQPGQGATLIITLPLRQRKPSGIGLDGNK